MPAWTIILIASLVLLLILLTLYALKWFSKPKKIELPPLEFVPISGSREKKESLQTDLSMQQKGAGSSPSPSTAKPPVTYPDYWLVWDAKTHSLRRRATVVDGTTEGEN